MKSRINIAFSLLLLLFVESSFAQQLTPAQQTLKQNLLDKSRSQKTAGFIMLGGGAVALTAGIALFAENFDIFSSDTNSGETGGVILATLGGASMIGSIFFFSASARNKREAESIGVGFKMEKGFRYLAGKPGQRYYPALSVRWQLR